MIEEGPGGGVVSRTYAHGARVDEIIASSNETGAVFFHHYDALGNCILLSDGAGVLREQYDYQAFGTPYFYNPAGTNIFSSPWGNRFLFKGREWLSDLKLYDNRHRLYSPGLGRFLQPDPTHFEGGDYNLYRYCHNDPVNKSDPLGLAWGVDPKMSDQYKNRALDQVARARALDPAIDQKFRNMEKNDAVNNVITSADTPENKKAGIFPDGSRGNSTEARGKDAIIFFNPDNWQSRNGYRDPVIGLVHELPHAERINNGTYDSNRFLDGLRQEREAIRFENIARRLIDGSHRNENYLHLDTPSNPTITYPYQ